MGCILKVGFQCVCAHRIYFEVVYAQVMRTQMNFIIIMTLRESHSNGMNKDSVLRADIEFVVGCFKENTSLCLGR